MTHLDEQDLSFDDWDELHFPRQKKQGFDVSLKAQFHDAVS